MIFDRLVMQINDNSYTQRFVEMYHTIKYISTYQGQRPYVRADQHNWRLILKETLHDLSVYNRLITIGSLPQDVSELTKVIDKFNVYKKFSKSFDFLVTDLEVTDLDISTSISIIIAVKKFLDNKKTLLKAKSKLDGFDNWLDSSLQQQFHRFYEGALSYEPLLSSKHK